MGQRGSTFKMITPPVKNAFARVVKQGFAVNGPNGTVHIV